MSWTFGIPGSNQPAFGAGGGGGGGGVVAGYAYLVQSEEAARKLEHYETKAYRVTASRIWMTDNSEPVEVLGRTFKYAGDSEALLQGRFDRKLWARQMTEKES